MYELTSKTETNIKRIIKEKDSTLFKDIYGGASFTAKELTVGFLIPAMQISIDPTSPEITDVETWLGRYVKV